MIQQQNTILMIPTPLEQQQQRIILNPKKILKKLPVNCTYCGIEFEAWQSRINRANKKQNGRLFCSRRCCKDYHPKRKEKFAWCINCHWVLRSELILIPKGSVGARKYISKKDQYQCPNCNDNITCKKKK
jgi:uncharacterized protein with PIN domain